MSKVKTQMTYPHYSLGQQPGYIGVDLQFQHLNYEQLMAVSLLRLQTPPMPEKELVELTYYINSPYGNSAQG